MPLGLRFPFLLALAPLLGSAVSTCKQGLGYYGNGLLKRIVPVASEDSGDLSREYVTEFRGSFVARVTGHHRFKIWCAVSDICASKAPESIFTFDGVFRIQGSGDQYYEDGLVKDFRYQIGQRVHTTFHSVGQSLSVEFQERDMAYLSEDLIATCAESGCRDLALSREASGCQPASAPSLGLSVPLAPSASLPPSKRRRPSGIARCSRACEQTAPARQTPAFAPPRFAPSVTPLISLTLPSDWSALSESRVRSQLCQPRRGALSPVFADFLAQSAPSGLFPPSPLFGRFPNPGGSSLNRSLLFSGSAERNSEGDSSDAGKLSLLGSVGIALVALIAAVSLIAREIQE